MKFLILLILFLNIQTIKSHPTLKTSFEIEIQPNSLQLKIISPLEEFQKAMGYSSIPEGELLLKVNEYVKKHIHFKNENGKFWDISLLEKSPELVANESEDSKDILLVLQYFPPEGKIPLYFVLESDWIQREVIDHQIIIAIKKDWEMGIFSHDPKIIGTIRIFANQISIDRKESSIWVGFKSTFQLGVLHILEGYDHLLFLLMLLLPAPLLSKKESMPYKSQKETLFYLIKIVTSFTIGHSLTLLLGSLKIIVPSSYIVEIVIAFSILISAIHVLIPYLSKLEFGVALLFGLIHGLAFSNTITEIGLNSRELILSILGFNLGIEFIQFLIILTFIPILFLLISLKIYHKISVILGWSGVILSIYWIYERV